MRTVIAPLVLCAGVICAGCDDAGGSACDLATPTTVSCQTLCNKLDCCRALPDEVCVQGVCSPLDCMTECAGDLPHAKPEVWQIAQDCMYAMSCDELGAAGPVGIGYDDCIQDAFFSQAPAITPDRETECAALEARAQTACTGDPACENNIPWVGTACRTVARFAGDTVWAELQACANVPGCLDLARCVSDLSCAPLLRRLNLCVGAPFFCSF